MTEATLPFHNRIALVFDFDETLAPTTYPRVLEACGFEAEAFEHERVQQLEADGWEHALARGYALIEAIHSQEKRLTEEDLAAIGRDFPLYDGVPDMFDRVRDTAAAIVSDIDIEFYLLTAGFAEVPQNTTIAHQFEAIFGGAFHFAADGQITAVKRIVTYPEKARYLLQIAKGLDMNNANPRDVYRDIEPEAWHVPVDQMIYVGDGASDMPAFAFMRREGGLAIGVYNEDSAEEWSGHDAMHGARRIQNLAPNDYSEGGELLTSLLLATKSICHKIALRRLGRHE